MVQDAYLRILSGSARYEGRSGLRTFLFGVVRRVAAQRARKRNRRLRLLQLVGARTRETSVAPIEPSDDAGRVRAALVRVSPRQAELLHLVFYEDLTIEGAAGVLGISVGTARTHYERGKARLRELLGESTTVRGTRGAIA